MKHSKIIITIPEPCHEDWNQMTPIEKGRFCDLCTKEVIDFSSNGDEEIIKYITKNKHACGRFHPSQLGRTLIADRKKRNHWISYAASLLFPFALFSQETKSTAKKTPKIEQDSSQKYTSIKIGSLHKNKKEAQNGIITINGTVYDDSNFPLPGATISKKGTKEDALTDFDGNYSLKVKVNDRIKISFVGFKTFTFIVTQDTLRYDATLKTDNSVICQVGGAMISYEPPRPVFLTERMKANRERVRNYYTFQKKKWKERREKRRQARAKRRAERAAKKQESKN